MGAFNEFVKQNTGQVAATAYTDSSRVQQAAQLTSAVAVFLLPAPSPNEVDISAAVQALSHARVVADSHSSKPGTCLGALSVKARRVSGLPFVGDRVEQRTALFFLL